MDNRYMASNMPCHPPKAKQLTENAIFYDTPLPPQHSLWYCKVMKLTIWISFRLNASNTLLWPYGILAYSRVHKFLCSICILKCNFRLFWFRFFGFHFTATSQHILGLIERILVFCSILFCGSIQNQWWLLGPICMSKQSE